MTTRRINIKQILRHPQLRRKLMVQAIITLQSREGITTTYAQALRAYEKIRKDNFDEKN